MATTITTTDPQALQVAAYMTSARQGKMAAQATEYGKAASASIEAETSPLNVVDTVQLSEEGRQAAMAGQQQNGTATPLVDPAAAQAGGEDGSSVADEQGEAVEEMNDGQETSESEGSNEDNNSSAAQLTEEEQQEVQDLAQRDREVQVHEAAHAAVGGPYTGAPSLTYETGPDGRRYAVSGEVNVDMSEVPGDPRATMEKADVIRAAALAPAQPSSQDRNVAAQASRMRAQAQAELMAEQAAQGSAMVERATTVSTMTPSASMDSDDKGQTLSSQFGGAVA
nr:putative metalloprotease CJM1_0395 family protein [uncultured Desulfuromonas sp.]